jgi:hypothetical protein
MTTTQRRRTTKREFEIYIEQSVKAKFKGPDEEDKYAETHTKVCSKCGEDKPLTNYQGNTSGKDAFNREGYRLRRPECRGCNVKVLQGLKRAKDIAKKEGISYKAPLGEVCGICQQPPTKGNELVFDHDHRTNRFRGYLHNVCNRSIGRTGDDVPSCGRVYNYLLKSDPTQPIDDDVGTDLLMHICANADAAKKMLNDRGLL